jgi:hypothetical protein
MLAAPKAFEDPSESFIDTFVFDISRPVIAELADLPDSVALFAKMVRGQCQWKCNCHKCGPSFGR